MKACTTTLVLKRSPARNAAVSVRKSLEMGRVRGKDTGPEVRVRSMLHKMGLRFRLHDKRLPGTPDIVLARWRAVVLVQGCFWHRHEGCRKASTPKTRREFWSKKFRDNVQRDRRNRAELEMSGWRVIEVWECEVKREDLGALLSDAIKGLGPN